MFKLRPSSLLYSLFNVCRISVFDRMARSLVDACKLPFLNFHSQFCCMSGTNKQYCLLPYIIPYFPCGTFVEVLFCVGVNFITLFTPFMCVSFKK